jgi:hypothetical protein
MSGRYDFCYSRNGQLTLFVNRMLNRDAGTYEAVATNPFGEARQQIKLDVAEHPRFIVRTKENICVTRETGQIHCRITGYPEWEVGRPQSFPLQNLYFLLNTTNFEVENFKNCYRFSQRKEYKQWRVLMTIFGN